MINDEDDRANDGWLDGSDHLELHRLGIPHPHPGGTGSLDQPQILIAVLTGIAWGLQYLKVDLASVSCTSPLNTGSKYVHDLVSQSILERHKIPNQSLAVSEGLVTPEGAAILAALSPRFIREEAISPTPKRVGLGIGGQIYQSAPHSGALMLFIHETS